MPGLKEYQSKTLAPGWLQDPAGRAFLESLGARKDALAALAKEAVKASLPTLCPVDALGELGTECGIDRGAAESEAAYRKRVRAAWDQWKWAGTSYGLLLALYYAGYTPSSGKVVIQTQKGRQHELRVDFDPAVNGPDDAVITTDIGAVVLGGSPQLWSQFAVLFVSPLPPAWVSTPPADASAEVESIRTLIRRWKPGHARCVALKVTPIDLWDFPTETWEPTTELWNEAGTTTTWTPPSG
jgi:hypothetical protein